MSEKHKNEAGVPAKKTTLAPQAPEKAAEVAPKKKTAAKPAAKAPAKAAPVKETAKKAVPAKAAPVKEIAKKEAPKEKAPVKKAPAAPPVRLLFAASEAVPFVKTGGLADVAGTLPVALAKLGVDARVILPKYRDIPYEWKAQMQHLAHFYVPLGWRSQYCGIQYIKHEGVTFYFVDNEFYFARDSIYGDGPEEGERFAFFCRAVLEALPYINFFPDVLHCNDWQTGMIPVLLRLQYQHNPQYTPIRTLYTIHNLKFQGMFNYQQIDDLLGIGTRYFTPEFLEFYGDISFMKGGLVFADHISTVSPTYAHEIQTPYYGERMDGLLKKRADTFSGILNGIDYDIWNPETDTQIEANYTPDNLAGKAACKARLQRELGLVEDESAMVIAMVSRLTEQKGLSLIEHVLHEIMQLPVQLVVVGQGDAHYGEMLTWAQWRYQGQVAARFEHNAWLARTAYAGADIFLMPSRFEPCGLSQLIALRYGTVPLVRETGGLVDTVIPYNKYTDEGTGFSFANYNAHEMLYTIERAQKYFLDKKLWARLVKRGMREQFDWGISARQYLQLYNSLLGRL
ncbi:glycogen synthase GlgA [Christensenellaceae bacterium OttesenSCG-928-L17]|nr:glycogen synthase GlgA [Christensenellaceae bacterium OttesenSCG-928-L17]